MLLRLFILFLGVSPWLTFPAAAQSLPTIELAAGMHRIEAEVVNTPATRMQGLMNRESMPVHRGMLFVFDAEARHCMWMKNTLLPLSVAFLDDDGRILNVEEMKPQTLNNHCAARPARYALEMNAGWFGSRGIKPGMQLRGIDRAPPPR
ncbi:MAG: DUF192 domain-containing protein [Gammaproteobacteria bacterium]|nr:DUF192 domain-containing protein [Gammaproteobacteria bacterium]MBU1416808.1 DUF192 domain-containing protein [Gammaproteobacteria bacterium]